MINIDHRVTPEILLPRTRKQGAVLACVEFLPISQSLVFTDLPNDVMARGYSSR